MSEIEFECPYCEAKNWLEIESMTDMDEWEIDCDECNKRFIYWVSYSVEGYTKVKQEGSSK